MVVTLPTVSGQAGTVFSPNFPDFARLLMLRRVPAVDFCGFVPGGRQDFDVHVGVPSRSYLVEGRDILNPLHMVMPWM